MSKLIFISALILSLPLIASAQEKSCTIKEYQQLIAIFSQIMADQTIQNSAVMDVLRKEEFKSLSQNALRLEASQRFRKSRKITEKSRISLINFLQKHPGCESTPNQLLKELENLGAE